MRILVTGGAGYIGAALTEHLARAPSVEHVTVYDNLSRGHRNFFSGRPRLPAGKVSFIEGEILDSRKLRRVVPGHDAVVHLAGSVSTPFAEQGAHVFEQTNNWGTAELVYAVEETEVRTFIYMSSAAVYGASSEWKDTTMPPHPSTYYGVSKLRGEGHVSRLASSSSAGRRVHIVRSGTVYGPGRSMRYETVVNRFVFDAHFARRMTVHGDGEQHRPVVHIDKVVTVLAYAIETGLPAPTVDLVDRTMSVSEIVDAVRTVYPDLELLFVNQHMRLLDLKVRPDPSILALFGVETPDLEAELRAFKGFFSF